MMDYLCTSCISNQGGICYWAHEHYPHAYDKCNNYNLSKINLGENMKRKPPAKVEKEEVKLPPPERWEVRNSEKEVTYMAYLPNPVTENPYE